MTNKTPTRIYRVRCTNSGDAWLVRAVSAQQAIRHCADHYAADVATQDDLVRMVADGAKVETAGQQAEGEQA